MSTTLAISDDIRTLGQIEEKLGITLTEDRQFFLEWLAAGEDRGGGGCIPVVEEGWAKPTPPTQLISRNLHKWDTPGGGWVDSLVESGTRVWRVRLVEYAIAAPQQSRGSSKYPATFRAVGRRSLMLV